MPEEKRGILGEFLVKSSRFRPADQVSLELIVCRLVKRQPSGVLLWRVTVEAEAYLQGAQHP